jgi:lipopolysaccharide heptosyltransferase I
MNPSMLRRRQFQRILLIKPSAVGDVIHALPVLAKLRRRYPSARIDWVLTPAIAELIGHHPALSNVVLFDRGITGGITAPARQWRDWLAGLGKMLADLWRTRYDLVLDLHGQFRSAILTMATHAPVRIGFDRPCLGPRSPTDRQLIKNAYRHGWTGTREGAWLAYTHRIPLPRSDIHAIDRYLLLTPILGLDEGPAEFQVPIPQHSESTIDALLSRFGLRSHSFAVVVPGTIWPTKHWHIEGFAAVARSRRRAGRLGRRARTLSGCGQSRSRRPQFFRANVALGAGRTHPPRRVVRHQRFRLDAPDRGAESSGSQRVRTDR